MQDILSHYSGWNTYWVKQQAEKEQRLTGKTIVETVDDLMFKSELDEWLKLSSEINPDPESAISKKHKQLIKNIFNHLWLTDYYGEAEESLINIILNSGKFRWYESVFFYDGNYLKFTPYLADREAPLSRKDLQIRAGTGNGELYPGSYSICIIIMAESAFIRR